MDVQVRNDKPLCIQDIFYLEAYTKLGILSYQRMAIIWFIFLGFSLKDICEIQMRDISKWDKDIGWLPPYLHASIRITIENTVKQLGLMRYRWTDDMLLSWFDSSGYLVDDIAFLLGDSEDDSKKATQRLRRDINSSVKGFVPDNNITIRKIQQCGKEFRNRVKEGRNQAKNPQTDRWLFSAKELDLH